MSLSEADRRWFLEQIQALDPEGAIVSVERDGAHVRYCNAIRSGETRHRKADPEELVRALTVLLLCSDEYGYEPERMYIEQTHTIGRPTSSGAQVDLTLFFAESESTESAFAMWEMKAPDQYKPDSDPLIEHQLFAVAPHVTPSLLVYSTVKPHARQIECITIDHKMHKTYVDWNEAGRESHTGFPARYGLPSFRSYRKSSPGAPDLNDRATTAAFRAIAAAFHAEFFAEHPDTEIFASVVKLLLAKIFDEYDCRPGAEYKFQVKQADGREETAAQLFVRVAELYQEAYATYIDEDEQDTLDPKLFSPDRVKAVVKGLQSVAITRGSALHGDVIGAFFEEILRSGFKQDKGMYFTHSNLVWFMLEAIDIKQLTIEKWKRAKHPDDRMPHVIDPACGSGAFLLRAMRLISSAIRDDRDNLVATQDDERYFNKHLADDDPNAWAKDFLYGCDPKFVMAITAKVNMVLHGDGAAHIFKWDSLRPLEESPDSRLLPRSTNRSLPISDYGPDLCEQFDVVVSNPPFGIKLAPETKRYVPRSFSLGASTSSESLFLERWAQLLKPNGRLGVVIPESLLNGAEYRESRLLLYRFFSIRAVVSLPRNLFIETPTLTSLLFAQKKDVASLQAWDNEWKAASETVEMAVGQALYGARTAAGASSPEASSVQGAFLSALTPYIDSRATVVKRGRASAVLTLTLPSHIADVDDALGYYEALAKTAGFKSLVANAVFALVAEAIPHEWSTYAVDEVGFKLSKRGERVRANQLCRFVDAEGNEQPNIQLVSEQVDTVIDAHAPTRILDYIRRDVSWA